MRFRLDQTEVVVMEVEQIHSNPKSHHKYVDSAGTQRYQEGPDEQETGEQELCWEVLKKNWDPVVDKKDHQQDTDDD